MRIFYLLVFLDSLFSNLIYLINIIKKTMKSGGPMPLIGHSVVAMGDYLVYYGGRDVHK